MRKNACPKQPRKIYSLLNDFAFRWIFGQQKHSQHTICLLNALLNLEGDNRIVSLKFLNPFNYKEFNEQKMSIVDTRVKDHLGRVYNIEVQLLPDPAFVPRSVYYLARLYSTQLEKGKGYERLNKATGVSILGFNLFKNSNQIVETFSFKNARADLELPETMELFYIDMTRFDVDKP